MNLVDGKIQDTGTCDAILESLEQRITATLSKPRISVERVIDACDRLVQAFDGTYYLSIMGEFGIPEELGKSYMAEACAIFSGKALRRRMKKELGEGYAQPLVYMDGEIAVTEQILPLGVLLHVAAGNADGLPAFSVLEGLLTGNINILKLPAAEGGISVRILTELIRIEPALAEYIYVFDYSSKDIINMKKLINAADAVVVWGGVEAVASFRSLLPPNIKLIEWGHKISFAYVTKDGMDEESLYAIAVNIASTGQLLCSSCQGIYIDTEDMSDVYAFCERFLPLLERAVAKHLGKVDFGITVQAALQRCSAELETIFTGSRVFGGKNCGITAEKGQSLEPASGVANPWVKMLPRERLLQTLRPYKNYLQTVALICDGAEKAALSDLLLKTGVVRVCEGARMSAAYSGAPHDGEYPLRRYTKIASVE